MFDVGRFERRIFKVKNNFNRLGNFFFQIAPLESSTSNCCNLRKIFPLSWRCQPRIRQRNCFSWASTTREKSTAAMSVYMAQFWRVSWSKKINLNSFPAGKRDLAYPIHSNLIFGLHFGL